MCTYYRYIYNIIKAKNESIAWSWMPRTGDVSLYVDLNDATTILPSTIMNVRGWMEKDKYKLY